MGKPHILFISSWYPTRDNPTHGIFNRYFAEAVSLQNKVSVLHASSENRPGKAMEIVATSENNITTITAYYKKVNGGIPVLSHLLKYYRLKKAFRAGYARLVESEGKPDLMQLNVVMPLGIMALYLSKVHKLPYVVNENWSGYTKEDGSYRGMLQKYFTRKIISRAKFILPTSEYLRDAMISQGLKGEYRVIPNVVDVHQFKPGERNTSKVTRLIHVSSLNEREKNVSGLLRGFSGALIKNKDLELVIVGTGKDEERYKQLVDRLRISERVHFKGRLMRADLVKELNDSHGLVMFSNYETFCLVIPEAFACGKPVITSAAGAIPSYMNPKLGLLVKVGDKAGLATAIIEFTQKRDTFDEATIRNFAVENFSYERVGEKLSEIYRQVIEEPRT